MTVGFGQAPGRGSATLPSLVTVAHGTRLSAGNRVAVAITAQARRRLEVPGTTSYVELCRPRFTDVMAGSHGPSVAVPLLLSSGFHTRVDLPAAVARSPYPVRLAGPLGPHPLLAEVMLRRLLGACARPDDPVVMAAAGSNDPAALVDLAEMTRLLQRRWDAPVHLATVTGCGPRLFDTVAAARTGGRVAVVPYLLAPGHFLGQVRRRAASAGASLVADVIGADPLVAELVVRRFAAALRDQSRAA
ncbi:sirohydrochlorin chelatase [Nocardioides jensenii]|uniref:sirohydrochlorin chelatase n=1 Tax=Nocardioides jensenii TaxID=1843 RepID=UPI00083399A3|nr:sirohydrochlorin chelatase [Nocardioides jensenii]